MILIVSHRRGFEADRVIDHLEALGKSVFRFNTDIVPGGDSISLLFESIRHSCQIRSEGKELDLTEVSAAWFQQPNAWELPKSPMEEARQASHAAAIEAALSHINAAWLNCPRHALAASRKPAQLWSARNVGLLTPKTLISNVPSVVKAFRLECGEIVAKSVSPQWIQSSSGDFAAYTQRVESTWLDSDEAISYAPVIYQQFHQRRRDIRVVVVGDRVFSASCASDDANTKYDVRKSASLIYEACLLPAREQFGLLAMMKELNVQHCSADFIECQNGDLLFVDLNVTGSWWWIDDVYSGAVTNAIADQLASLADRHGN